MVYCLFIFFKEHTNLICQMLEWVARNALMAFKICILQAPVIDLNETRLTNAFCIISLMGLCNRVLVMKKKKKRKKISSFILYKQEGLLPL